MFSPPPTYAPAGNREDPARTYAEAVRTLAKAGRNWYLQARALQEYGEANSLVGAVANLPDTVEVDGQTVPNLVPGTDLTVADAKRMFVVFGAVMALLTTPLEATGEAPAVTLSRAI